MRVRRFINFLYLFSPYTRVDYASPSEDHLRDLHLNAARGGERAGVILRNICVANITIITGDLVFTSKLLIILMLSPVPCGSQSPVRLQTCVATLRVAGRVQTTPQNLVKIAVVRLKS